MDMSNITNFVFNNRKIIGRIGSVLTILGLVTKNCQSMIEKQKLQNELDVRDARIKKEIYDKISNEDCEEEPQNN